MPDEPQRSEAQYKGKVVGRVGGCQLVIVTDPNGKKHIEATCLTKEARDELAAILEEEAVLRVNPKVKLEDEPPVLEPESKPDTRLNITES